MSNDLTHYGVPGMKWGVRKAKKKSKRPTREQAKAYRKRMKAEFNEKAKVKGSVQWETKQKRQRQLVQLAISTAAFAASPIGRGLIKVGKDYINRKMALNYSHKMNMKYGSIPDNAVTKGLDFAKKRFGAYNISSL